MCCSGVVGKQEHAIAAPAPKLVTKNTSPVSARRISASHVNHRREHGARVEARMLMLFANANSRLSFERRYRASLSARLKSNPSRYVMYSRRISGREKGIWLQ